MNVSPASSRIQRGTRPGAGTARAFGVFKACGPPQTVSRARYTIGLVMVVIPLLLGWGGPYFGKHIPGFTEQPMIYAIAGDLLLLIGLFVLGGDFWDKLRSLFIHDARALIPKKPAATSGPAH